MPRRYGIIHIGFLTAFGLAGWSALVLQTLWPQPIFAGWSYSWELIGALVLVGGARLLAFRVFRRARIALDSSFYVAARFAFGTVPAAWLLAATLTVDGAVSLLRGSGPVPRGEAPLRHTFAYGVYNGGLPCLVLILVSGAFGGDRPIELLDDVTLLWMVPAFFVAFLTGHYLVAGGTARFIGLSGAALWREFFVRVMGAEVSLAPLALAMALAYKHQGVGLFLLIGATGLLFGGIFRRWTIASENLHQRVEELSAINRIGRTISNSYDQHTLFKKLSVASLQLVGQGSSFMIGLLDDARESVAYEIYDARGDCVQQIVAGKDDGLSGWVMDKREGLCLGNLQRQYLKYAKDDRYNDSDYHSWLGVPLIVYGEVVGVLSVQSRQRHAYTMPHLRVLATIADQAAVAVENSRLYQLATVDGLTGLFVRRYFDQRLTEEWHRSARYDTAFSLGIFDLDHFKGLNDTYGHQVGDQVLREAARVVRDNMRSFDVAARYGGEEFAFILPRTTLSEAAKVAERIRADVARIAIEVPDALVRVTTSIGLAQFPSEGMKEASDMVARADAALYRAKAAGRNSVELSAATLVDIEPLQAGARI